MLGPTLTLLLILIVTTLIAQTPRGQSDIKDSIYNPTDSPCYVRLRSGETVPATSVRLHSSSYSSYLILDGDRQIPLVQVYRYRSARGLFAVFGGAIYRVERDGPRITLYSRVVYDANIVNGYDSQTGIASSYGGNIRNYYFQKTADTRIYPADYATLKDALADNVASLRALRATRTKLTGGLAVILTSVIAEPVGIILSVRKNPTHSVLPVVAAGTVGIVAGLALVLRSRHSTFRAVEIYNR